MPTLLVPLNELLFATTDGARAQGPRTGAIVASWSKSATADLRATKRRIDRLTDIEKGGRHGPAARSNAKAYLTRFPAIGA